MAETIVRAAGRLAAANEVDDARWMPAGAARGALTYEHDRRILDSFTSSG